VVVVVLEVLRQLRFPLLVEPCDHRSAQVGPVVELESVDAFRSA
jgi:hypothetical protein